MSTTMAGSMYTGGENLTLTRVLSEKYKERSFKRTVRHGLLDVVDDIIIAWSKEDGCLLTQVTNPPDSKVQILAVSKPPVWDVERIKMNRSGSCVALIGRRGVAVVELPQRSGDPALYDKGKDTVTCRVEYIAERFFSCHPKLEVMTAAWHPGSIDDNHVVILASDNYLRIYNLSSHEIPEQAISVGSSGSGIVNGSTLGENAIAFNFGLPSEPVKLVPGNAVSNGVTTPVVDAEDEMKQKCLELKWPIFILHGNGEIYLTITTFSTKRSAPHIVYGPLSMTPACDTNYGVDTCDLLVLQSSPPVVVIATSTGQLHHCIVIDNKLEKNCNDTLANGFWTNEVAPVRLHVYETIELEMSLLSTDEGFSTPLLLHADPTTPTRYWVSHEAGVHGVIFSVVDYLQYNDQPEDAAFSDNESQSVVDHVICTRSLAPAAPMPVVGLVANTTHSLYVLLASGKLIQISVPSAFVPNITEPCNGDVDLSVSPLRKIHVQPFEDHIRSTLHRVSSQPLLTSGSVSKVTPNEYMNLLNRVIETLRTNYLQPQLTAKEDIQRRSDILIEQKQRLQGEISNLLSRKRQLTEKAHELAEKYEEANDRQTQLVHRLEKVLNQVSRGLPVLSAGEKNMLLELDAMQKHTVIFTNQLSEIQAKDKWQTSQMEKLQSTEAVKAHASPSVSESQLRALKQALSKESEKLSTLLQRVNQVKRDLQL
ncbi:nuclear pore complex protein Nup88-like [Penaeus chinensis]|uniref:nuclear pore complex protein Nup88-like n=1 Tax=Penaeus chinensis TaxID=139456 RepID=UPI001FB75598|nr:nuclear pore complex protein Nup88-like [Penaeus chinensis]